MVPFCAPPFLPRTAMPRADGPDRRHRSLRGCPRPLPPWRPRPRSKPRPPARRTGPAWMGASGLRPHRPQRFRHWFSKGWRGRSKRRAGRCRPPNRPHRWRPSAGLERGERRRTTAPSSRRANRRRSRNCPRRRRHNRNAAACSLAILFVHVAARLRKSRLA